MLIAEVWIEHPVMNIDRTFSYQADGFAVERGMRVAVDFNNRRLVGFVDQVVDSSLDRSAYQDRYGYELKPLLEVIDKKPLINEELYRLAQEMAQRTISPRIACFQCILPPKISPKSNNQHIKYLDYVRYTDDCADLTSKQAAAYAFLKDKPAVLRSDWRKQFGPSVTKVLEQKGLVSVFAQEARYQAEKLTELSAPLTLTAEQQAAYDEIINSQDQVFLLHGATGSGKTEVYLHLTQQAIAKGRQALILVPEIALTPQMMTRVRERFGDQVAIYHSGLNDQEKYEQFMRVFDNEVAVVVGTRSAVFMPFAHLGLIVMDEEHDHSYKQDNMPCYHCRDIALARGRYHHCKVIMGSATPALESYARAVKGVYHLVELQHRINERPLPACRLIDIRKTLRQGQTDILAAPLQQAIAERLEHGQQVILLLNRRGYAPIQQCLDCGQVITCPDCDVAMNYHKDKNMLVCHTCGRMLPIMTECPKCHGHHWIRSGYGTQKVEEELNRCFPDARILRMDADTVGRRHAHQKILDAFGQHQADILLGTQMIAKGLDYPLVTLVGIINADAALSRSDFRSAEVTFDLIVQASGRSGRGMAEGEVMIQAYDPAHYAIQTASHHDYKSFYNYEMRYRHAGKYPPYTYLISLVFAHSELEQLRDPVAALAQELRRNPAYKVLGPTELYRTFKNYRLRIILKGRDLDGMIADVTRCRQQFAKEYPKLQPLIDVNPLRVE